MDNVTRKRKALTVRPLKTSQTAGAVLAFQGMAKAMPLLHGSQGCSAFTKVAFVRHFREPIAIQTTAMDQTSTIMGAEDNLVEAMATLAAKSGAELLGVVTTGLSDTQGCDLQRAIFRFRESYPQWREWPVVPVHAPDFTGSMESGFALAVTAMVEHLAPARPWQGEKQPRINVLTNASLTPGDLETLDELLCAFGLEAAFLPNLADSLDGHLAEGEFSPITRGGTPLTFFAEYHTACATLVIGSSMAVAAQRLQLRCPMPLLSFDHLMGLDATDKLVVELCRLTEKSPPRQVDRWRRQMQDAMLDCHYTLGEKRVALAGEVDMVAGFHQLLEEIGARTVAAVVPDCKAPLGNLHLTVGDLDDMESLAVQKQAEWMIGNSQLAETSERLSLPLLRAGFPVFDRLGGFRQVRIGYKGGRDTLFEMANLLLPRQSHGVAPYVGTLRPLLETLGGKNDDPNMESMARSPQSSQRQHG
ncbi:MAG: nitrogenase iron-molybdenum cofactor biosynthesis protein NifN [Magnetococcales bacterium]|nr:nitrogenase iron-molybdenum cofactor biosynthesis protein NifN [Magnetococcales bacterium]NGZ25914.1 nitrogenase iron-molybdenum cofactor biosynthesis protein NifN [Magnetococcales bacterium]